MESQPMEPVVVRAAKLDDAPAMARVHVAAWHSAYADLLSPTFLTSLDVGRAEERWATTLADQPETTVRYLVAEAGARNVIGICAVGKARDAVVANTGELRMINVHPSWWRCGVGTALLIQGKNELAAMGYRQAYLWVLEGNHRARAFYESHGWAATAVRRIDHRLVDAPEEMQYNHAM